MDPVAVNKKPVAADSRLRSLSGVWLFIFRMCAFLLVCLAVNQAFNFNFFIGYALMENRYLFAIIGLMVPMTFIFFPHRKTAKRDRVPWFDIILALATLTIIVYYIVNGMRMNDHGWEMSAPNHAVFVSYLFWIIVIEASRRAGGISLAIIVTVISLYPIYADRLPGPISGFYSPIDVTASYHAMSSEAILGIPLRVFGNLIVGFIIFGAALQHTGAGRFFITFAFALFGHVRGGPAKVAIFSSGLMGSMSGSVITNVLTTGVMTIPAMRRTGLSPAYAGGVETCASTGGVLMPPVMGATAFVMANLLNVPYANVALAAAIPSILYFYGLFVQIDAHAAREKITGMPREELPSVWEALREGWYYLFAFILLVFMLLVLKREVLAPYYATPVLIIINQIASPKDRWGIKELYGFFESLGRLFAELVAILAAIGLIIGALSVTGLAGTLVNDLLFIAGDSAFLLLLMGAVTSFILGIGMTVTAAYVFLAILLAPALITIGLNAMAVHLFILYWGMLSFITPPVALGAFAAATVAKANPMKTGFEAMRLGSIIYFIPFFFVFDPAFILVGPWYNSITVFGFALLGILFVASGLQGYLIGVGNLFVGSRFEWPMRIAVLIGGLCLATPGGGEIPWAKQTLVITATGLIVPAVILARWQNRKIIASVND